MYALAITNRTHDQRRLRRVYTPKKQVRDVKMEGVTQGREDPVTHENIGLPGRPWSGPISS